MTDLQPFTTDALVNELRALIERTRTRVAQTINSELAWLHWRVGARLRTEVLGDERAAYGEQIVRAVAGALSVDFGRGFSRSNLYYMMKFAEVFPDPEIVHALRGQLSWTHFREIIAIDDPLKRQFYTELCRVERWSTRTLKDKLNGMLFERTSIAKQPGAVIAQTLDELRDDWKNSAVL